MESKDMVGIIITLVLSVMALAAGWYVRSMERSLDKIGIRTMGKVVSNDAVARIDSSGAQVRWYKGIEFVTKEGKAVLIQSRVAWIPNEKNIGTMIPVIYDPADPERGVIDTFLEREMAWLIPTIVGGANLLILAAIAVWF